MNNAKYDFKNHKEDALTKPRDKAWENWAKFEKVGDSVQGFIRDVFYREAEGQFTDQRGITLEQVNGELINVGIKRVDFVLKKTDNLRLGDPLTIELEREIPSTIKGYSPTKAMAFYGKNLTENDNQKTVLQLEREDMKLVDEEDKKIDDEFNGIGKEEDPLVETPEEKAAIAADPTTTDNLAKAEAAAEKEEVAVASKEGDPIPEAPKA